MRHLRRMKRIYSAKSHALQAALEANGYRAHIGGLGAVMYLPDDVPDIDVAREARVHGLAPVPLSPWFSPGTVHRPGLLLGVATVDEARLATACRQLHRLIEDAALKARPRS
jgi:GntR family transcriptional regulator/MocR family aminotransferase